MLVIRNEQKDTLIKGTDGEWVDFLVSQVKTEDPELQNEYSDDDLRLMVKSGIRRSEGYGITGAKDQSAFVSIMFNVAPNFDDQPEIRAVLDNERFPAPQRMENLWSPAVPDTVWDKAKEARDERAWRFGED